MLPPIVPPPLLASKIVASHYTAPLSFVASLFCPYIIHGFCPQFLPADDCPAAPACHPVAIAVPVAAISYFVIKKPIYMKSSISAVIGKLTFGTLFLLSVAAANAQSTASGAGPTDNAAMVKYLGTQDDMLVFNVAYDNPQGSKFLVTIKDQDGNQLYQRFFNDKSFYKEFKLPKTDKDKVVFILRNGQEAPVVKTFAVNVSSRFVQEVAIKKID